MKDKGAKGPKNYWVRTRQTYDRPFGPSCSVEDSEQASRILSCPSYFGLTFQLALLHLLLNHSMYDICQDQSNQLLLDLRWLRRRQVAGRSRQSYSLAARTH